MSEQGTSKHTILPRLSISESAAAQKDQFFQDLRRAFVAEILC
jgi:hypothetical protein